jgi:hypothetical protein
MAAAIAHAGILWACGASLGIFGIDKLRVSFAGHTATHSRHPVHSADLIVTNWSTGNADGQAFAHFAQSMHVFTFRRMRAGLTSDVIPNSAPYGHR